MLRITQLEAGEGVGALRLEGSLTAHTVSELLSSSERALAQWRSVVLELADVKFADGQGTAALRRLKARGCVLIGASAFLVAMLREGTEGASGSGNDDSGDDTDVELLEGLRTGREAAFEQLVRRHSASLLAVARRILPSEDDARDAVQEAFLSAYRGIASFAGNAKLSTWLHRIVVNAALMKLRSRRRRPEEAIDDLLPEFDENGDWVSGAPHGESTVERHVASSEMRAMLRRCIARLPDRHRTILVLRDIEDLDTDEAARALGISANAAKIRLHRARQALRTLIERERIANTVGTTSGARRPAASAHGVVTPVGRPLEGA